MKVVKNKRVQQTGDDEAHDQEYSHRVIGKVVKGSDLICRHKVRQAESLAWCLSTCCVESIVQLICVDVFPIYQHPCTNKTG